MSYKISQLRYRPEIDGLRAIAILPVLLFHAGLCRGGYVGVDIFFVISGYLICSIILDGLQTDKFSFKQFYMRRIRRILPALYLVASLSSVAAYFLMNARQLVSFGKSLISVVLFCSNIYFCIGKNYFSDAQDFIPLLHTWSLGVEEQFYLFFPLLLVLLWRYARSKLLAVLISLMLLSFGLTELLNNQHKIANFFLLPSRIWELMLGAILAYFEAIRGRTPHRYLQLSLPILGAAAIVWSIVNFNAMSHHPGIITLVPVLGTAAIIWFCGNNDLITKILQTKTLVSIGLISYSLYLWHVPILVFSRMCNSGSVPSLILAIFIPLSMLLAYLTWFFLERPFRNRNLIKTKLVLVYVAILSCSLLLIGYLYKAKIIGPYLKLPTTLYASMKHDPKNRICEYDAVCRGFCPLGTPTNQLDFLVVGDSHAKFAFSAFRKVALQSGTYGVGVYHNGCMPLLDIPTAPSRDVDSYCVRMRKEVLDFVQNYQPKNVFLVARWSNYEHLYDWDEHKAAVQQASHKYRMNETINFYRANGARVFILLQVPEQSYASEVYKDIYWTVAQKRPEQLQKLSTNYYDYINFNHIFNTMVQQITDPNVVLIDPSVSFCKDGVCPVGTLDRSYYTDANHISIVGSELLEPLFAETFEKYLVK